MRITTRCSQPLALCFFVHTYGSDLIDAGATIVEVADLMGHDSIQTTMVYQRNADLERTRAVANSRPYAAGVRVMNRAM